MGMTLRGFLEDLEKSGDLVRVSAEVDPRYELAAILNKARERPMLFENVRGQGFRVFGGICSDRRYFARGLGVPESQLVQRIAWALEHPSAPPLAANGHCQEVVVKDPDIGKLPLLHHFRNDAGPYATAAIAVVKDPETGRNLSYHRLLPVGRDRVAARLVERRQADTTWRKTRDDVPVAICIGSSVPVLVAAALSPPPGVDELGIADALSPTPLVRCKTVPLEVPAETEFVLEGRITHATAREGPFVDLTGTWDLVRQQPVIQIDCITHRRDALYQALLPGKLEHKYLMGMPKEANIMSEVGKVTSCLDVHMTPGGCSWLHAVVKIRKSGPDDAKKAIEAAFKGHGSLKHVIVVDEDVDPRDAERVEWSVATRFQSDKGLWTGSRLPGSSLDPSADKPPGEKSRTAKMGIDATIPWGRSRDDFVRVDYDDADLSRVMMDAGDEEARGPRRQAKR